MKSLLLGCLFFSFAAQAEPLRVNVTNFNFNYHNPYGEGEASSFTRNQRNSESVQVRVEKVDENFLLSVTGAENEEFELKNAPSFMTEAETMNVTGLNLNLQDTFSFSLTSGRFNSRDDQLKLDGVSVNCQRDLTQEAEMDQLIKGCITQMSFKTSKFSSESVNKNVLTAFTESVAAALNEKNNAGVNSLDLKVKGGRYDLSANVKADISGKVKSHGQMSYNPETGVLTLKISEVKFTFLNITGKVFDELKKQENDKLTVSEPYVYYKVK